VMWGEDILSLDLARDAATAQAAANGGRA
jgi:hypothetical protein